jgi:hypothetical protein
MKTITLLVTFLTLTAFGQSKLDKEAAEIVAEGKRLFQSEMASWYGTDLFLEKYTERENIGGYFSYVENDVAKCVFFSKAATPQVIGTMSFDSSYDVKTATTDLTGREFTPIETDLYTIRKLALQEIQTDTLFKRYNNTNLNLVPLINGKEKKVYVLTGPTQSGVVIFGNDYLLTFDRNNKLTSKKELHKNIIPIEYGGKMEEGKEIESTLHSHLPESGDYITATDVCTLMLYGKFTKWKSHHVVSQKYLNIWNCETNELNVIPMKTIEKINEDQKKRNKKKEKVD